MRDSLGKIKNKNQFSIINKFMYENSITKVQHQKLLKQNNK